ncbi:PIN domain-containing protein [Catenulispora subtropica]|uniref:PIN domain-containing protein n=1 Tax=Catenulispora subtropica TaxID=450798 RepID=A0ABN2RPS6_9ACTN
MQTAFLDTCVLYPATLRDVLLRLAEADVFGPLWSELVLDELRRNLEPVVGRESAGRLLSALRGAFGDSVVVGFEHRVGDMANHWKDRHVLAATVHSEAEVLVTTNLKDFPRLVPETGARVLHPDEYLVELLETSPGVVLETLTAKVEQHRREPRTLDGLLTVLAKSVPRFAEGVRRRDFARHAE